MTGVICDPPNMSKTQASLVGTRKRPVVWAIMGDQVGMMPTWSLHPPSRPSHHRDAACLHAAGHALPPGTAVPWLGSPVRAKFAQ